jgi:hypothetical protein
MQSQAPNFDKNTNYSGEAEIQIGTAMAKMREIAQGLYNSTPQI